MKMKMGDRILMSFNILVVIALSLGLLCIALNVIPLSYFKGLIAGLDYNGPFILVTLAISLVLLAASVRLLTAGTSRKKPASAVLKTTDLGMIRVSLETLDTLTQKAVHSFQEVRDVVSTVLPEADEGVRIKLKVTILPDVRMPELTQNIQEKVKKYVEEMSGIAVREVLVYIDNLTVARPSRVE